MRVGSVDSFHAPTWGSSAVLLRCRAVILRCRAQRVSARYINNGRSPQNCIERSCVSAKLSNAILRDDELIGCDCKKMPYTTTPRWLRSRLRLQKKRTTEVVR